MSEEGVGVALSGQAKDHRLLIRAIQPCRASKFSGVHSLTLHFPETLGGGDATQINFVGFKGTCVSRDRRAVEAVYETKPMPSDHKVADLAGAAWRLG